MTNYEILIETLKTDINKRELNIEILKNKLQVEMETVKEVAIDNISSKLDRLLYFNARIKEEKESQTLSVKLLADLTKV